MVVAYDGSAFHGWQIQPGCRTVQGAIEEALATILRRRTRVYAAGRTDAGVHALGQVVAFDADGAPELDALAAGISALTRRDVAVREIAEAAPAFDPRRDARSRTYEYRIWNERWLSPFERSISWHWPRDLDLEAMREAARSLVGEHDFSAFRATDCDARNPVRVVTDSSWSRDAGTLVYRISATAFLRHMVRNVVGTLVEVGSGARGVEGFRAVLAARDRNLAGPTAPPEGLFLVAVRY